jgi:hypothetical protein
MNEALRPIHRLEAEAGGPKQGNLTGRQHPFPAPDLIAPHVTAGVDLDAADFLPNRPGEDR